MAYSLSVAERKKKKKTEQGDSGSFCSILPVIASYGLQVFPLYVNTLTFEKMPYSCEVGPFEGGVLLKIHGSLKHTFFSSK